MASFRRMSVVSNRSMPGEFLDMVKYPWRGAGSSLSLRSFSLWELWLSQKEGSAVEWKGWKRTGLGADAMVCFEGLLSSSSSSSSSFFVLVIPAKNLSKL